jgi:hypothetical protein
MATSNELGTILDRIASTPTAQMICADSAVR